MFGFVLDLSADLTEADIEDGPVQPGLGRHVPAGRVLGAARGARHVLHPQVLQRDVRELSHELLRQQMLRRSAPLRHQPAQARDLVPGSPPSCALAVRGQTARVTVRGDHRLGGRRDDGHTEVDPDHPGVLLSAGGPGRRRDGDADVERRPPLMAIPGDRHHLHYTPGGHYPR